MLQYIIGVLVGFISYAVYNVIYERANTPIELLKNALLTYALTKIKSTDFHCNFNYTEFDGTKLPTLSGYNVPNACFSYMSKFSYISPLHSKNYSYFNPLYSKNMAAKTHAIEKYLKQNLNTNEKILHFFEQYVACENVARTDN